MVTMYLSDLRVELTGCCLISLQQLQLLRGPYICRSEDKRDAGEFSDDSSGTPLLEEYARHREHGEWKSAASSGGVLDSA